jgi:hypothetical protein
MSLDLKFAESVLNLEHRVLGKRLRPFSLWHALLLEAIQSPIWLGRGMLTLPDLHSAVAICSNEWPKFTLKADTFTILRNTFLRGERLERESKKLVAYFNDYNSVPMLWTADKAEKKEAPKCALPMALDLVAWLVRHGFGEARRIPASHDDSRTLGARRPRGCKANPGASAEDDHCFTG